MRREEKTLCMNATGERRNNVHLFLEFRHFQTMKPLKLCLKLYTWAQNIYILFDVCIC